MVETLCELPVDYILSDIERDRLGVELARVTLSPYKFYEPFRRQVRALIQDQRIPDGLVNLCREVAHRDRDERPTVVIRNAPIDIDLPILDYDAPLESKYQRKKTFVAEAFLEMFAGLIGSPAFGRVEIHNGDLFHDIHPMRSRAQTQSLKGLLGQPFHKDMANQAVVPDEVLMLGLRSDPANEVYTSFVRNVDVLDLLDAAERQLLRQPVFQTAADDADDEPPRHAVLSGRAMFRFIEGRTRSVQPDADELALKVRKLTHHCRKRVLLAPGDFVCVYNNHALHAREVVNVRDEETYQQRWIMKTINLDDIESYRTSFVPGTDYLLAG
jgi:L-asparagine oxygenase